MEEGMNQEVDALRADFNKLREDLAALTKTLKEQTRQKAADGLSDLKTKTDEYRTGFEDQIREKPLETVLAAFGIGLVLGKLFSR